MYSSVCVDFLGNISHLGCIWCWVLHYYCLHEEWPNIIPNIIVLFGSSFALLA